MQLKINKLSINFIVISILLNINISAYAVISNIEYNIDRSIYIESDTQLLDMKNNIVTFLGNVTIAHKAIKINADKVIITNFGDKQDKEIINGYGNPITFYQVQNNSKYVTGNALQIYYELAKNYIVLTGDACLNHLDNNLAGYKIVYLIKERKIQVFSGKGKRVIANLLISQLRN